MDTESKSMEVLTSGSRGAGSRPVGVTPRPSRRWMTRVLAPAVVLGASAGLLLYTGRAALTPSVAVEVVPVVVKAGVAGDEKGRDAEAKAGGMAVATQAPGWIEPDPYAVNVAALANGVVKEVVVLEGQRVAQGDVVAQLVDDDARLELARAEAEVRQRMAEMVAAEADLKFAKVMFDNPTEQNRAAAVADAALAEDRAELARLPLEVAAQSAKLDELKDDLKRKMELAEKRAISEGEVIQLRLRVQAQEAELDAAKALRPILEARVRASEAAAFAAREQLRLRSHDTRDLTRGYAMVEVAKAATALAEAARDEARLRVDRMQVRAPVAGVVMARLTEPGSKVMMEMDDPSSAWVVRLYDPEKLQVRVDVPLASAGGLGVGMAAEVTVEALPGRVFKGRVTRMVHEANIQKNTVQVKVALETPSPEMKPEMLARVKLFTQEGEESLGSAAGGAAGGSGVVMAPLSLLLSGAGEAVEAGGSARAWVVDRSRGVASLREVRLGGFARTEEGEAVGATAGWIAVVEGLRPGDRLIAGDVSRLREGARVRVVGEKEETNGVH